jgi:hypothetical protein
MSKYLVPLVSSLLSICAVCQAGSSPNRAEYTPYSNQQREIAYDNNRQNVDSDLQSQEGITRHSNWDYQQGWRNNRNAYFRGETQDQVYEDSHPNGRGGIGYTTDYRNSGQNGSRDARSYDYYKNSESNFLRNDRLNRYDRNDPRWNDRGYPDSLYGPGGNEFSYNDPNDPRNIRSRDNDRNDDRQNRVDNRR